MFGHLIYSRNIYIQRNGEIILHQGYWQCDVIRYLRAVTYNRLLKNENQEIYDNYISTFPC